MCLHGRATCVGVLGSVFLQAVAACDGDGRMVMCLLCVAAVGRAVWWHIGDEAIFASVTGYVLVTLVGITWGVPAACSEVKSAGGFR